LAGPLATRAGFTLVPRLTAREETRPYRWIDHPTISEIHLGGRCISVTDASGIDRHFR
jgi:hypothetical protein